MTLLDSLTDRLAAAADPVQAAAMQAYMKGHFPFLGVKAPQRRALAQDFIREVGGAGDWVDPALVRALWALPAREYQYVAVDLLARCERRAPATALDLYEELVTTKSWWDTVDLIASQLCGPLLWRCPAERASRPLAWLASEQMWLQRTALLYQLKYRERTDWPRLQTLVLALADQREFFLTKAMGWALRTYAKTDPAAVAAFIAAHHLPALTRREALKAFRPAGRP